MPRATGRNRPSGPDDESSAARTPPKPAADHTGAIGGNLPWPFAPEQPPDADVVGIEIFDTPEDPADAEAKTEAEPVVDGEPAAVAPDPGTADAPDPDAAPGPRRSGHGDQPTSSARVSDEPPRPGSSRPGSRTAAPPRSRTRPPGPVGIGRTPPRRPGTAEPATFDDDPSTPEPSALLAPTAPTAHMELPADEVAPPAEPATEVLSVPAASPAEAPARAVDAPTALPGTPVELPERPESPKRPVRPSFLTPDPDVPPARHGLRGVLNRFGLALAPSAAEDEERRSIAALSRAHEQPRTIAVVNGKGGSNKTPTAAVLAAVLARYGGASVLAWDNNETRGTLGWRTEGSGHAASVPELLAAADGLLGPDANASDLARFVHHQTLDRYDVLRSGGPAGGRLTRTQYDVVHRLARRYYRTVVVDSGNDESADRWQRMVERADRLVVATTALGEHVESGMLLLEALAAGGGRAAELAASAVVIVSQSDRDRHHGDARRVAAELRRSGLEVVVVPYDRSLHSGAIRYDALGPASKRAWRQAAAVVAEVHG